MANAVNDIAYWKSEFDKAKTSGKPKASLDWISKQAQGSYSQLDEATANTLKGMNATQAYDYSKKQPVASTTPTQEPFTMESFANMLKTMGSRMPQPTQKVGTDFTGLQFAGDAATQKNMLEMMQDIYQAELPYNHATVKDQLDYKVKNQDSMGYDETGRMTVSGMGLMGYDNEGSPTLEGSKVQDQSAQDWTKIFGQDANGNQTFEAQKFGTEFGQKQAVDSDTSAQNWAEIYGYDANGNLTVSGVKANNDTTTANANAWYKKEEAAQGWDDVKIRQQRADQDHAIDLKNVAINQGTLDETIKNNAAKLTDTSTRDTYLAKAGQAKVLMDSAAAEMKRAQDIMNNPDFSQKTAEGKKAFEDFQKAYVRYQTAYASIDDSAELGIVAGAAEASRIAGIPQGTKDYIARTQDSSAMNFGSGTSKLLEIAATNKAKEMKLSKTSGQRSAEKNAAVGGSKTSDHLTDRAADYAGTPKQMEAFAQWAAKSGKYTKVIYGGRNLITGNKDKNHDDHVHLSW